MIPLEYWAIIIGAAGGAAVLLSARHGRFAEAFGWVFIAGLVAGLLMVLGGCAQPPAPRADAMEVCVSEGKMEVLASGKKLREYPVKTSPRGVGNRLRSYKTPLGEFTVTKEPAHRFGKVLRLSGFQGWRRGILIHQGRGHSRGCIHMSEADLSELFRLIDDGARLHIF